MHYHAIADQFERISGSNEDNNQDRKTMGPH